jgi:hypothetical protein
MAHNARAPFRRAFIALVLGGLVMLPAIVGKAAANIPAASGAKVSGGASSTQGPSTQGQPDKGPCRSVRRKLWVEPEGWVVKRVPVACYSVDLPGGTADAA